MLVIRLSRVGKKKQPEYRLTISEKTKDPWGNVLEYLGYFNPRTEPPTIDFDEEKIKYWLGKGAQPSDTVRNLFIEKGIITGDKAKPSGVSVKKKKSEKEDKESGDKSATEEKKEEAKPEPAKEEKS